MYIYIYNVYIGSLLMTHLEELSDKMPPPPDPKDTEAKDAAESTKLRAWLRSLQ